VLVDSLFPKGRLFAALHALRDNHPHVQLDLAIAMPARGTLLSAATPGRHPRIDIHGEALPGDAADYAAMLLGLG
jgi:hypothetical protein